MFRQSGVVMITSGVSMPPFDNFTLALSAGNTVETWKFYVGSSQKAQWVLTYTDSSRDTIVSGVFTDLSA